MLEIQHLTVNYGGIQALQDISVTVQSGEIVTLIGANGAGKSTTLRSISRIVSPRLGQIIYEGENLLKKRPDEVVKMGIAHVPEGRRVLARLTVEDNLLLGAYTRNDGAIQKDLHHQFERFPRLAERRKQQAGTLSGGEQQMLAMARALMSRPRLLLLDEPSLGLAPIIVKSIFQIIRDLNSNSGVTILLVEQNAQLALNTATRGYVLEAGTVKITGSSADLLGDDRVKQAYLG